VSGMFGLMAPIGSIFYQRGAASMKAKMERLMERMKIPNCGTFIGKIILFSS